MDERDGDVIVGVITDGGVARLQGLSSISEILRGDLADVDACMSRRGEIRPTEHLRLLPPIDGATEVWAAGVTYLASREARVEESDVSDVYQKVYDAERPELFFKSQSWRVTTDGEPIAVRSDSPNNVPEPEVGLVLNRHGDLVGYVIVDDVSSRSIEGENPLYLPQAKVYDGSCALGPSIIPRALVPDETALGIRMTIRRGEGIVFQGESSTSRLKRRFAELSEFLTRQSTFPDGVILATGTSVVPALTMTLEVGDTVEIEIDHLGDLTTPVASATAVGDWLAMRRDDPGLRFERVGEEG